MNTSKITVWIPLLFMAIGLASLLWGEREFQRRADRDNAELREDLKEAGVSKPESAALLSAQTKLEANASSYTQLTTLITFIVTIFSTVPLYSRMAFKKRIDEG